MSTSKQPPHHSDLPQLIERLEADLLARWIQEQLSATSRRKDLIKESELREQSSQFFAALRTAMSSHNMTDTSRPEWSGVRDILNSISRSRAAQGFSPSETAMFVFSLRAPVLDMLQR